MASWLMRIVISSGQSTCNRRAICSGLQARVHLRSFLLSPMAIASQNRICSSRRAAGGRPGEGNGARPDRADRRFRMLIATSNFRVLRRPLESAQYAALAYRKLLAEHKLAGSMGRRGNPYDNAKGRELHENPEGRGRVPDG